MLKCIVIDELSTNFKYQIQITENLIFVKYSLEEYNNNSEFLEKIFDCVIRVIDINKEIVSDLNFNNDNLDKMVLIPIEESTDINLSSQFKEGCNNDLNYLFNIEDNDFSDNIPNVYFKSDDLTNDLLKKKTKENLYSQPLILQKNEDKFIIYFKDLIFELPYDKLKNINYKIGDIYNIEIEKEQDQILTYYKDENIKTNNLKKKYDLVIFGASGFIGSKIVEEAEKKGLKILKISRSIKDGLQANSTDIEKYKNVLKEAKAIVISIGSFPIHHKFTKLSLQEQIEKNGLTNSVPISGAKDSDIEKLFLINAKMPNILKYLAPGYVKGKKIAEDALLKAFGIPERYIFKISVVHNNKTLQKLLDKFYNTKFGKFINDHLGKPVIRQDIADKIINEL
jgi:hypothetical protein